MAPMAKFLFENSFDEKELKATFDRKAMEEIRLKSFEEGQEKGRQAALDDIQNQLKIASTSLGEQISSLLSTEEKVRDTFHKAALEISQTITMRVIPSLATKGAREEVEAIVRKALDSFSERAPVNIYVHPTLREPMQAYVTGMGEDVVERVKIIEKEGLDISDCKVESPLGSVERITKAIWDDVNEVLKSYHPEIDEQDTQTVAHEGGQL